MVREIVLFDIRGPQTTHEVGCSMLRDETFLQLKINID